MKKSMIAPIIFGVFFGVGLTFGGSVHASDSTVPQLKVYNTETQGINADFFAFDSRFGGGGYPATGDTNGDGKDEIFVGAGVGGGPHVRGFNENGREVFNFFPFHPNFRGGVTVAMGDVDGDGKDELIAGQASKGQAWVKVYRVNAEHTVLANFMAYPSQFQGGIYVAAGDVNGDGKDEVITGSGAGSSGHVRVFDGSGRFLGWDAYPFPSSNKGGAAVATANVYGGTESAIVTVVPAFGQAHVKVYKYDAGRSIIGDFNAFPSSYKGGAMIAGGDIDQDGKDEIVVGAANGGPQVRSFEAYGAAKSLSFFAYAQDFRGGVRVALGDVNEDGKQELMTMPGRRVYQGRTDLYKYIEVDISEQKLTAYEGGMLVKESLVSTGISKFPTPIGTFHVSRKVLSTRMSWVYGPNNPNNYDLPGVPHVLVFDGPYTLHGAYWHNAFGTRRSHGCVNLPLPFAADLYRWADIGTTVIVHP